MDPGCHSRLLIIHPLYFLSLSFLPLFAHTIYSNSNFTPQILKLPTSHHTHSNHSFKSMIFKFKLKFKHSLGSKCDKLNMT
uniref:Uncharacterized protein n=1 Tax=Arundo donax TaxID=35708 RepID=A0A0A9E507_ARUDO